MKPNVITEPSPNDEYECHPQYDEHPDDPRLLGSLMFWLGITRYMPLLSFGSAPLDTALDTSCATTLVLTAVDPDTVALPPYTRLFDMRLPVPCVYEVTMFHHPDPPRLLTKLVRIACTVDVLPDPCAPDQSPYHTRYTDTLPSITGPPW